MERVYRVLTLLALPVLLWAQTPPSGYTPNFLFRKWASGANPGADSLNANWTGIDASIFSAKRGAIWPAATSTHDFGTTSLRWDSSFANYYVGTALSLSGAATISGNSSTIELPATLRETSGTGTLFLSSATDDPVELRYYKGSATRTMWNLNYQPGSSGRFQFTDSTGTIRSILAQGTGGLTLGSTAGTGANPIYIGSGYVGTTQFIDASRNLTNIGTIQGTDITATGFLQTHGMLYHRSNIQILNKAESGWVIWGTRNTAGSETLLDLTNIGTISSGAITSTGLLTGTQFKADRNTGSDVNIFWGYNAGAGAIDITLQRDGGTASTWVMYIPSASTDLRFYSGGDKITFTSVGAATFAGTGTFQGGAVISQHATNPLFQLNKTAATARIWNLQYNSSALRLTDATAAVDALILADVTGAATFAGAITAGGHILPSLTDTYDIGSSTKFWRKGWLSELQAVVFAENTISVMGGWFYVAHGQGSVEEDVDGSETQIDFGSGGNLAQNDFVVFRNDGNLEYMQIGTNVSGNNWNVTRNVDGSGANTWAQGTAFANLGYNGDARIELNADSSARISLIKQGTAYNSQQEVMRFGDLANNWGYGSTQMPGIGLGVYETGKNSVTIDTSNGIRFFDGTTQRGSLSSSTWTLGSTASEHASISSTSFQLKDGASVYTDLTAGVMTLGLVSGGEYMTLDGTNGIKLYGGGNNTFSLSNAGLLTLKSSTGTKRMEIVSDTLAFYVSDARKVWIGSSVKYGTPGIAIRDGTADFDSSAIYVRSVSEAEPIVAIIDPGSISGVGVTGISATAQGNTANKFYTAITGFANPSNSTGTTGYGLFAKASGAATNYAIYADDGNVGIKNKITLYNNVATEGYGVPAIVDYTSATGQTASIGATSLSNTTATGVYRVSIYLEAEQPDAIGSTVYATLRWEGDSGENITENTATIDLTSDDTQNTHKTFFINHTGAGAVSIQYSTTYSGALDSYLVKVIAERLN